jgi:hypothetical protein
LAFICYQLAGDFFDLKSPMPLSLARNTGISGGRPLTAPNFRTMPAMALQSSR